jgi:hypothetical protein
LLLERAPPADPEEDFPDFAVLRPEAVDDFLEVDPRPAPAALRPEAAIDFFELDFRPAPAVLRPEGVVDFFEADLRPAPAAPRPEAVVDFFEADVRPAPRVDPLDAPPAARAAFLVFPVDAFFAPVVRLPRAARPAPCRPVGRAVVPLADLSSSDLPLPSPGMRSLRPPIFSPTEERRSPTASIVSPSFSLRSIPGSKCSDGRGLRGATDPAGQCSPR